MEGKVNRKIKYGLAGILSSAVIMSSALMASADTSVYAEGAYDDTGLDVYIYADIPDALVSMGIRVAYDSTKLTVNSAEKNEDVWYFGDSTTKYHYKDPEDDGSGVIRVKIFKEEVKKFANFEKGDCVDIIGRVREYEGENYIVPEIIVRVDDPNYEFLRRIELEVLDKSQEA